MTFIDGFLSAVFLFFIGSVLGWCVEVLFRRCFTAKKWINPGFLTGPYLPLYGFGVAGLFGISLIPIHTGYAWLDALLIILIMGIAMTNSGTTPTAGGIFRASSARSSPCFGSSRRRPSILS